MDFDKENFVLGMVVVKHTTIEKDNEEPIYRVALRSIDKKTTLKLEIPDAKKHIFTQFPKGTVLDLLLSAPCQKTLDAYEESNDEKEENDD